MKKKIYCFNNGGSPGWYHGVALAEDGMGLAGHISSSISFIKHDLGITSNWKHENYNEHYGEGNWELVWVDNPLEHEGCKKAIELNCELAEKNKEVKE